MLVVLCVVDSLLFCWVCVYLVVQVVDAENAVCHLLPFIAGESQSVRQKILDTVTDAMSDTVTRD